MFRKASFISGLAVAAAIFGTAGYFRSHRPPLDLSSARVALRYQPVAIGAMPSPARLVGAWEVTAADARFGGVSGLAIDRGRLLALTDTGMLLWLDRPGTQQPMATIRALPAVAGNPSSKIGRDSEALVRDPAGRGWWVAFEQIHRLVLYDATFTRVIDRLPVIGARFAPNQGVEAIYSSDGMINWIAESTGVSDAASLPGGGEMTLRRRFGLRGFRAQLVGGGRSIALPLDWSDNPEALTVEPLPDGGTRLWIMTDNDFTAWRRTLLVAIDLPPPSPPASPPTR